MMIKGKGKGNSFSNGPDGCGEAMNGGPGCWKSRSIQNALAVTTTFWDLV